jgi:WD40 repeat protein
MDLLAFVSDTDEITLNRLSGQRVWSVLPTTPKDVKCSPCQVAWRPDGKVLVVCFDNGDTHFLDVNDGKVVNVMTHDKTKARKGSIDILKWTEGIVPTASSSVSTG